MDGYIKNKLERIRSVRKTIIAKYSTTVFLIVLIPLWVFALVSNQPPEKWQQTEIQFSHLSEENVDLQRWHSDVLNTKDGKKFVLNANYIDIKNLSDHLVPGNTYSLVFSKSGTIWGGNIVEALFDENTVFQDLDDAISRWKREQQKYTIATMITLLLELAALILIDRFWCKKEHSKIQKLKADIKRREDLMSNK